MNLNDYAWNNHEKRLKENNKITIPSKYKIKIKDDIYLRIKLENLLETFSQKMLAEWALLNAKRFIKYIDVSDEHLKKSVIDTAEDIFYKRLNGSVNAYELRQVGFLANKLSKESTSDLSKIASRVFAQAIATGHMRGHAIVSSDYAVKFVNLEKDNCVDSVVDERNEQLNLAYELKQL
ncbi:putative immunity protein [Jeotgalicoccus sp. S0W5]|uniref:putative immunity protein n=1 Tax=Jeotgalicoccus sp. S0W5 TaxID=2527874 RepID=UPI0014150E47|nr:hypothetical protein [Jeotgalicoccus sp. S0W5]